MDRGFGYSEQSKTTSLQDQINVNEEVLKDERNRKQKQADSEKTEKIVQKNLKLYNIELTNLDKKAKNVNNEVFESTQGFDKSLYDINSKKEQKNQKENWFGYKKIFYYPNGAYFNFYDNLSLLQKQNFQYQFPIITISGFPTYIFEWKRLQQSLKNQTCRIIHFVIPGLEEEDERRGDKFFGYMFENVQLFLDLINSFRFQKVIVAAHSFGTYLQQEFLSSYPERVAGIMEIGGFGYYMYIFSYDNGLERYFYEIRNPKHKILKFVANGKNDHLIPRQIQDEKLTLYLYDKKSNPYRKLNENEKKYFLKLVEKDQILREKLDIQNFDFDNIQSNFIFLFDETGHSIHRRRGQELQAPIRAFLALVEAQNTENQLLQPKL
ncbi:hypothetical protein PPERSA_10213 [Pseudocohnilembus persalinus]|uniref:Uncharacterized protein n=1 Tax=Pseudocohnilembus persalinus TaxID=266149 RepID=A0A0V0QLW8_PSEPJ|nr:hypothetical protein PPERSA_10213 [Pseudocohnilembus persalinus]|eukprot:KRX03132.1 hypothetical protein PPERSA_10213 [Pseudocohnilembus persalinus]